MTVWSGRPAGERGCCAFARPGDRDKGEEGVCRLPGLRSLGSGDFPAGEAALATAHRLGLTPVTALVRRSTLEDVFLALTGRTLVD